MLQYTLNLLALSAVVLGQTGPAPVVSNNQYGAEYGVHVDKGPGSLNGMFDFKSISKGVLVGFNINGFNVSDEITYTYHIHERSVPADGNCNATGEHFDPYHVGAAHQCDPNQPQLCQLGDLSGKHGPIVVNASHPVFATGFSDDFLSTTVGDTAYFGNLSIVVHRKRDGFRLQCGNIEMAGQGTLANGSTKTTSDSARLQTSSAMSNISVSMSQNASHTIDAPTATPTSSDTTGNIPFGSGTASSTMSLQSGNHGNGRVEASLLMLGLTAIVPVVFL